MSLLAEVLKTTAISGTIILALVIAVIGPRHVRVALRDWRARFVSLWPYIVLTGGVVALRKLTQGYAETFTWLLDLNLTTYIYALEGNFIGLFQTVTWPPVSSYLSFMYLYGYVVLIAFPAIAYFCLPQMDRLRELLVAYIVNDAIGVVFYVTFISYGPRNLGVDLVDPILYQIYPEAATMTGAVNIPINVFPSLHTSMTATVFLLAWRTRRLYPAWTVIAGVFSASVVFSTIYLGIHWASDVLAGLFLAAFAVYVAVRHVEGRPVRGRFTIEQPTAT